MAVLTNQQKRFVVMALAKFDGPTEASRALKKEFGIDVPRTQLLAYDPHAAQGKDLSAGLRKLFEDTRADFVTNIERQPFAHKAVRLHRLEHIYETAVTSSNHRAALGAVEGARKEMLPVFGFGAGAGDDEGEGGESDGERERGTLYLTFASPLSGTGVPKFVDEPTAPAPSPVQSIAAPATTATAPATTELSTNPEGVTTDAPQQPPPPAAFVE